DLPGVIAVPNDAVRSVREASAIAVMLSMDPDSVSADIKAQQGNRGGGGGGGGGGATKTGTKTGTSPGEVALGPVAPAQQQQQQAGNNQQGGGRGRVQVTPEECAAITAAIDKHPREKAKLDELSSKMREPGAD